MAERIKIGILFSYSEGWIGGTYYFLNLIRALNTLNDNDKPHLIIVSESEASYQLVKEEGYPYLSYLNKHLQLSFWERAFNKLGRMLFNRNIIAKKHPASALPTLFGYYEQLVDFNCDRKLYWIPDLQDRYYPEYFEAQDLANRTAVQQLLANATAEIVFSSEASKKDFDLYYPSNRSQKYVVNFAVTHPNLSEVDIAAVLAKYKIEKPYFFAPNQFWSHKNHQVILAAVKALKDEGKAITVVFTGNEKTNGGGYAASLKQFVITNDLQNNCLFLGFIDREDQLVLLKEAVAVVQPSLFEGWSTVVEDAKSNQKLVIASNLAVHHEQLGKNALFFDPKDKIELKQQLLAYEGFNFEASDYAQNIAQFAAKFITLVKDRNN